MSIFEEVPLILNYKNNTMSLLIENIISIDDSGMPKPPTINQLLDKDICLLYARDNTKDK